MNKYLFIIAGAKTELLQRIPGTAEPGGLPYMGSQRFGYDLICLEAAAASKVGGIKQGSFY